MFANRRLVLLAGIVGGLAVLGGALYASVLPGLSVARQEPSKAEVAIASWLLRHSVPAEARNAVSPLREHLDPAAVTAGHDLFTQKCESCHAYDGGGKTEVGSGEFPRTPVLRVLAKDLTDGEI